MHRDAIAGSIAAIDGVIVTPCEYDSKGYCLDVQVTAQTLLQAVSVIDHCGFFIEAITGVDWLGEKTARHKEALDRAKAVIAAAAKSAAEKGEEPPPAPPLPQPPEDMTDELEVVYDFNRYDDFCRISMRVRVPRSTPCLPTISAIYSGADWHERETHDFFGIRFEGHPNLVPLLLPEDADFHPLLKDFKA
ncbi:MAG TPA: NADH-quinone oxidoreductase subunit C [Deltaproteobacteria bacterium]|nr:NADH-quinone oxidoreductase subunit C [Deltaproteobacteria bacterium]HQB39776.1 NADH-quinone oxidoreductase subunit C [Deltaproteobacteria bacterium]